MSRGSWMVPGVDVEALGEPRRRSDMRASPSEAVHMIPSMTPRAFRRRTFRIPTENTCQRLLIRPDERRPQCGWNPRTVGEDMCDALSARAKARVTPELEHGLGNGHADEDGSEVRQKSLAEGTGS